jgi:hypothetical protein
MGRLPVPFFMRNQTLKEGLVNKILYCSFAFGLWIIFNATDSAWALAKRPKESGEPPRMDSPASQPPNARDLQVATGEIAPSNQTARD